jgi:hypothetical protein
MITNELITQIAALDVPETVFSYTLFDSDKFQYSRHQEPLVNLPDRFRPHTIVFRTAKFENVEGVHNIVVPQLSAYGNHLYRYLAAASKAMLIYFMGADEPRPHMDLLRCVNTAIDFNYEMVVALMECHPTNLVGGRCVIRSQRMKEELIQMLRNRKASSSWNCDQELLTDLVLDARPSLVINAPVGVYKADTQNWLLRRLHRQPTIIVREPNKYDLV